MLVGDQRAALHPSIADTANASDWSVQSADSFTHVHVESRWNSTTTQWSQPELVGDPFLRIHGLASVFHYGQEVFEGLKGCANVPEFSFGDLI
jgi:hypothetical protein